MFFFKPLMPEHNLSEHKEFTVILNVCFWQTRDLKGISQGRGMGTGRVSASHNQRRPNHKRDTVLHLSVTCVCVFQGNLAIVGTNLNTRSSNCWILNFTIVYTTYETPIVENFLKTEKSFVLQFAWSNDLKVPGVCEWQLSVCQVCWGQNQCLSLENPATSLQYTEDACNL